MTQYGRILMLLLAFLCLIAGCAKKSTSLDAAYGKRRGFPGGKSVNGTAVLCHMFTAAGFRVNSSRRLSRGIEGTDVVVWTPNDFDLPDTTRQEYFNDWLLDGYDRTIVFIGRDFDAAIDYWNHMVETAPPKDSIKYRRQLAKAKANWQSQRQHNWLNRNACEWFDWDYDHPSRTIKDISGPWSQGIDATKLQLQATAKLLLPNDVAHRKRLRRKRQQAKENADKASRSVKTKSKKKNDTANVDADEVQAEESDPAAFEESESNRDTSDDEQDKESAAEEKENESDEEEGGGDNAVETENVRNRWVVTPLLRSGDEVLAASIARPRWGESRIIVVTNGSWLLNMPLINHEHRKLAGKLIEECDGRKVVFLEGDANPYISDGQEGHPFLHAFTVWPLNCILLHLTTLGIVYCFSVFPIFGRPRALPPDKLSDFGKHLTAFGALLVKTEDVEYARRTLKTYRQKLHKDLPDETLTVGANPFQIAAASQSGNPFQQTPPADAVATTAAVTTAPEPNTKQEPTR